MYICIYIYIYQSIATYINRYIYIYRCVCVYVAPIRRPEKQGGDSVIMNIVQSESDTCLAVAVAYLVPDITDEEKKSLVLPASAEETGGDQQPYQAWLNKCGLVAANHGLEFRLVKHSVKRPSGKLLLFGQLNYRLFDCPAGGDWSHCVSIDTVENYLACNNLDDPDPANHAAYGRNGWMTTNRYLTQIHATYRLVEARRPTVRTTSSTPPPAGSPPSSRSPETTRSRKRRQPDTGFMYNAATISARDTKRHANELFTASLDRVCKTMAPGTVMYLDGDDGNTSRYISGAIKRRHTTLIVNFDPLVIAALVTRNTGASLLTASVNTWSMRVMEASVVGCWLDFCATLYGDTASSPFTDICNLVYRRAFRAGGIVAITLCTRDSKTCDPSSELPGKLVRMFVGNYPAASIQDVFHYSGMLYCSIQL